MSKSKLMLIDGNSILNRAYYGLPPLTDPDGAPIGAVYGFLNILFKFINEDEPDKIIVAFDRSEPTFRHNYYEEYKAGRKPADEDFKVQIPLIREMLEAMNISVISKAGFEADDLIGTLSLTGEKNGDDVVIISGDKDLLQLVSEKVTVKNPKTYKGKTTTVVYNPETVYEEFGVTPDEFVDLKALMGDSSDNIPGVPGVGPKTAAILIKEYHDVDNLIAHIDDIDKKSLKEKLAANIDKIHLSKYLATIDRNVLDVSDLVKNEDKGDLITPEAVALFKKYNFKTLLKKIEDKEDFAGENVKDKTQDLLEPDIVRINDDVEFNELVKKIKDAVSAGESCGLAVQDDDGLIAAVAYKNTVFVTNALFIREDIILGKIRSLIDFAGKNSKNLPAAGKLYALDIKGIMIKTAKPEEFPTEGVLDLSLAEYILNPLAAGEGYEACAKDFAGVDLDKDIKKSKEKRCIYEAYIGAALGGQVFEKLKKEGGYELYADIEAPVAKVLARLTLNGIGVDRDTLRKLSLSLGKKCIELEEDIIKEAGCEFNINSPVQLSEVLFEKMHLPHGKKIKKGYSTAADVLEKLAGDHKIARDILSYRTVAKLKSTYTEGLVPFIREDDKIHGDFNQTVTATGRISSTNPNLQNIPVRQEGKQIRAAFVPSKGNIFIDADYSQIELRILAHMSGDEGLIESYRQDKDIHKVTAAQVFGVKVSEVTPEMRRAAKAVNFGIIYGISSFGLGQDLDISQKEAKAYIENYFKTFPKVKSFLDGLVEQAKEKGYSETLFGRRRPIAELSSSRHNIRAFGERVAMNAPIQGTAADIMKKAMVDVQDILYTNSMKSKLVLQVHDELLIDAVPDEVDEVKNILVSAMTGAADLKVPLVVDIGTGKNWMLAH